MKMDILKFLRNGEKIKADIEWARKNYILRERARMEKRIANFENEKRNWYEANS